ncbi:probable glycosyltransferase At5g03795 [Cornus florida]|uniref:probable glycosyltransferase At5g03795 n=1 Tax=Cornus florida TaxID=4283 RepID=UPI00289C4C14|nr:probable glycosyltransferase At5g03795 [Cornus florida]
MGDCKKKLFSWWKSSSSSSSSSTTRLLWLIAPFFVVFGFVALVGPKASNWVFASDYYPWVWSSVISSSSSSVTMNPNFTEGPISSPKERSSLLDLPRMVGSNHIEEALSDDSLLNRSSSPPLAVEAIEIQQPVEKKEQILNITMNVSYSILSTNVSHDPPMTLQRRGKNIKLERLEAGLGRARVAIREAKNGNVTLDDPDYLPRGPIYWNSNAFHRSYLEMEKQFKVFVYEEGEQPIFHNGPCGSIYAMEGNFIHKMEFCRFRTKNPDKAHVYFLPFSVAQMVHFLYVSNSHDWRPMRQTVKDYVNLIAGKYPYWNRSLAADHFMLACHDWGPELSFTVPHLHQNAIRALCNANTSEKFNPAKDVSFPEIHLPGGRTTGLLGGPSPSRRPVLVFFAGGVHGPVRPVLLEHWENKDEDVQVHKYLPKGVSYLGMMRKSKYCICASGYEVASPRMVEALYTGCVPVLIKDHYVAPFSDVLNWKSFSVEIPVKEIPNLKKILMGISQRQYIRMQRRSVQVRRHFEINSPPKRYDVFHMILHSVWLRRLNVRVHDIQSS